MSKTVKAIVFLLVVGITLQLLSFSSFSAADRVSVFLEKASVLKNYIFSDKNISDTIKSELTESYGTANFTVFLSLGNKNEQASVINGTGKNLEEAWENAVKIAEEKIKQTNYNVYYLKADLVNYMKQITTSELSSLIKNNNFNMSFLHGISLNSSFKTAFLEGELNANKLIDYGESKSLDINAVNKYLTGIGKKSISKIPEKLIVFSCRGYIFENNKCYTLNFNRDLNYGRRIINNVNNTYIESIVNNSARRLAGLVGSDGKFTYGIMPCVDAKIKGYSILRHAGSLWSMICAYKLTNNKSLIPAINKAMDFLIGEVVYKDKNTAFLLERNNKEIKVGGNGLMLLALAEYADAFNTEKYNNIAKKLGNGILSLLDTKTGKYTHVLYYGDSSNKDFKVKREYSVVFYDGEATFGLCKLYEMTGIKKYLNGAASASDRFIKENYETIGDHWVSYSMNEITKYLPEEKYFELGLKNAELNYKKYYNKKTAGHTNLEMMMSSFELYDRIISTNADVKYLEQFSSKHFINTIFERSDYHLNAYFYPEYAIYFKNPNNLIRTFFIRSDDFRVRIDDIQHFIGGYYLYAKNYNRLISAV